MPTLPDRLYTVDEFLACIEEGDKADLIDGVIYAAPPQSLRNDDLTGFILSLMRPYARRSELGRVTGSRGAYELGRYRALEPDLAFVRRERLDRIQRTHVVGPPDLAIEIVSEDSHERDYRIKRRLYEEAGVREYWILDPVARRHEFLRLREGAFEPVSLEQDRYFVSEALPGFWLDIDWLNAEPLPDELDCLQQIFAGPPL